jgi:hypothetical protein
LRCWGRGYELRRRNRKDSSAKPFDDSHSTTFIGDGFCGLFGQRVRGDVEMRIRCQFDNHTDRNFNRALVGNMIFITMLQQFNLHSFKRGSNRRGRICRDNRNVFQTRVLHRILTDNTTREIDYH